MNKAPDIRKEEISKILNEAWHMRYTNPQRGLDLSQDCLEQLKLSGWNDLIGVALRNEGAMYWFLSDYNSALVKLLSALNFVQSDDNKPLEASILNWLGNTHERLGNNSAAFDFHIKSLNLRVFLNDREGQATSLNNLGNLYVRLSDFATALDYYLQALTLRQSMGDNAAIGASLNNITIVYFHLKNYEKAVFYAERSVSLFQHTPDLQGYASALNNYALTLHKLGRIKDAIELHQKSLDLRRDIGDQQGISNSLNNLGLIYLEEKHYDQALEYFLESVCISEKVGDRFFESETLLNIASLYELRANVEKGEGTAQVSVIDDQPIKEVLAPAHLIDRHLLGFAIDYGIRALEIAKQIESKQLIFESHLLLCNVNRKLGNFKTSLQHYKDYHAINVAVFNQHHDEKLRVLNLKFERERAEKEAEIFKLKNVELAEKNRELEKATTLKTQFVTIAAQDLKMPLATISSYADMMLSAKDQVDYRIPKRIEGIASSMLGIINRVLKIGMLDSGNFEFQRRQFPLTEPLWMAYEALSHKASERGHEITLDLDMAHRVEADDRHLYDVFENILLNAIQFSAENTPIQVAILPIKDNVDYIRYDLNVDKKWIKAVIRDYGQGFSLEDKSKLFQPFQRLSSQKLDGDIAVGLGLAISKEICLRSGGNLFIESPGKGRGSTALVILPSAE